MKYLIFIALFVMACNQPQKQKEGILKGHLTWVTGNQMPGPDRIPDPGQPVQRVVVIYPPVYRQDCEMNANGLYSEIPGEAVSRVLSDTGGVFITNLPEGKYSVFTREKEGLFASTFDGEGIINPVYINARDTTEINIQINYSAAY